MILILLSVSLVGCASFNTESITNIFSESLTDNVTDKTLSLVGTWKQEDAPDDETYMAATIRDDGYIGVFFIVEGEPYTYWTGTYEEPKGVNGTFSWVSHTLGNTALLASKADTKEFNYSDGVLSFEMTIEGKTGRIKMTESDWDTSIIPNEVFASVDSSNTDIKNLEIKDTSWYVRNGYLYAFFILYNPNENIAVEYPRIRITARDETNSVINTNDEVLSIIYPEQGFAFGTQVCAVDENPYNVDFELTPIEERNLKNVKVLDEYQPLEVINATVRDTAFVGEISNSNTYNLDNVVVVVVGKDSNNDVVYIGHTFVDDVSANSTTPFSVSYWDSGLELVNVDYYANQW